MSPWPTLTLVVSFEGGDATFFVGSFALSHSWQPPSGFLLFAISCSGRLACTKSAWPVRAWHRSSAPFEHLLRRRWKPKLSDQHVDEHLPCKERLRNQAEIHIYALAEQVDRPPATAPVLQPLVDGEAVEKQEQ
jgi:hypothetical protein